MGADVRMTMEALEPLDLRCCNTVGEIVERMSRCSFGARMLGEVAATLTEWVKETPRPILVYDGQDFATGLGRLLRKMKDRGWFSRLEEPESYAQRGTGDLVVIVGRFSEQYEEKLFSLPDRAIFINSYGLARPDQVRDGHYPDVVFSDPRLIMPILFATLEERIEGRAWAVPKLIEEFQAYGGVASEVAHGAEIIRAMVEDSECTVFLTISGAMTIAKMGLTFCDAIDEEMVQYLACTGALMAHGLVESIGLKHYKYHTDHDDALLAEQKINRITDTLEPEENFDHVGEIIDTVLDGMDGLEPMNSTSFHRLVGKYLAEHYPEERGILKSAYLKGVPVSTPAFVDSEIGNDVYIYNLRRAQLGRPALLMDLERDSRVLIEMATKGKRLGILSIGGGVPRNNVQNVAPLIEIINTRIGMNLPESQFSYGCRICPDPMFHGHLSGCTYSEGMSWRKMSVTGRFSEIHADATLVWPFLLKYVMERRAGKTNT